MSYPLVYWAYTMSSTRQVLKAGVLALVLALAIIASAAFLMPMTSNLTTTSTAYSSQGSQVSQTSQVSSSQVEASQGQMDVLLTDPPTVPAGVTDVYVTYSHVSLHNSSGWIDTNAKGTLDLMKMVNVSTTIAAVKVPVGVYNAVRFNVSSALVTYNSVNYTAFVPKAMLTVSIPGGIQVTSTKSSAAIVDMHPTVMNIGSKSTPEFIVNTAASCYQVPPSAVNTDMDHWGFRMNLWNMPWWTQINEKYTSNVQITTAALSSNSLSVTIKNTGSDDVNLTTISVMPLGYECVSPMTTQTSTGTSATATAGEHESYELRLPQCFTGSELFAVLSNGTLRSLPELLLGGNLPMAISGPHPINFFDNPGYDLAAGQSVTLKFSGTIAFGFSLFGRTPPGVISGDQYDVTVVGPQALAQYVVVAT